MPDDNIPVDTNEPVSFASSPSVHATIHNAGPDTAIYKNEDTVSAVDYDGTIEKGDSVTFTDGIHWVKSLGNSRLFASYRKEVEPIRSGTKLKIGTKGFVEHNGDRTVRRPTGFASIEWKGTVTPEHMTQQDTLVIERTP